MPVSAVSAVASRAPRLLVAAVALLSSGMLSSCGGAPPTTQLAVTSLMTDCLASDDSCHGRPTEGATVEVTGVGGESVRSGLLDESGYIAFDVDPGTYEVVVTKNDVSTERSEVTVSSGQYVTLPMNLPKPDYWP